ncbi:MAG TPA: helix-hairpin-helix domain-containing protein [Armatimonadota bacterium]|nr:helix-hairpin-helix domain-containing protein [Armatimonadota bacterium]HPP75526.1 helix-hairpin-helix domain-containing protein [Armatimonadota bacterium]
MEKKTSYLIIGMAAGAAVGAGTAMLLTPMSGKEAREKARQKAQGAYSSARQQVSSATQMIGRKGGSMRAVDLNKAGKEELMQIEGIGPDMAESIIAYRSQHGGFGSLDELENAVGASVVSTFNLKGKFHI